MLSGSLLIFVPSGKLLQTAPDLLRASPFADFLLPGLILVSVNGFGQLVAGILTLRRHPQAGLWGGVFGIGLLIWIFVQANMIGGRDVLQYLYFTFGVGETVLAFFIDRELRP